MEDHWTERTAFSVMTAAERLPPGPLRFLVTIVGVLFAFPFLALFCLLVVMPEMFKEAPKAFGEILKEMWGSKP